MKLLRGIPVERAQDVAYKGQGGLTYISFSKIIGINTQFTKQVSIGCSISVPQIEMEFQVLQVVSDREILVEQKNFEKEIINANYSYKIIPKMDYSDMYNCVWESLNNNECIGIFPEGGSHDQTNILPLKAGVCIMALGAMAKYNKQVTIITAGLNYFGGHRFRSKMILEFGQPYKIPEELMKLYQLNKREAIKELLHTISGRLQDVITTGPSYKHLVTIYIARRIYIPDNLKTTPKEGLQLNRLFSQWYQETQDQEQVRQLFEEIKAYRSKLHEIGIKDMEVKGFEKKQPKDTIDLLLSIIKLVLAFGLSLPSILLNGPIALLLRYMAEKERVRCLKASKVKVLGKDVVASYQVMLGATIFPISHSIYTVIFWYICKKYIFRRNKVKVTLFTVLYFFIVPFLQLLMLKSSDGAFRYSRNVKAKLLFLLYGQKYICLKDQRYYLQQKIRKIIDEFKQELLSENNPSRNQSYEDLFRVSKRISKLKSTSDLTQAFNVLETVNMNYSDDD